MREELIKILNSRLENINHSIEELKKLNKKIDDTNEKINYMKSNIAIFKSDNDEYNINNFTKLDRDNFDKILLEIDSSVLKSFSTNNCNYEGLTYIINGINNGISLSLTKEQESAIKLLIEKMSTKLEEYIENFNHYTSIKNDLDISELSTLENMKDKYDKIVSKTEENEYIDDVDTIVEAINESGILENKMISIFAYLLKHNADIYNAHKYENSQDVTLSEESNDHENNDILNDHEQTFHFQSLDNIDDTNTSKNEELDTANEIDLTSDLTKDDNLPFEERHEEESHEEENLLSPVSIENNIEDPKPNEEFELQVNDIIQPKETINEIRSEDFSSDDYVNEDENNEEKENIFSKIEEYNPFTILNNKKHESEHEDLLPPIEEKTFSDNITLENVQEELPTNNSEDDVNKMLIEIGYVHDKISDEDKNALLTAKYQEVIEALKENNMYSSLILNTNAFIKTLINSNKEMITRVREILNDVLPINYGEDLIMNFINVLPSVLISNPVGNYNNFVKNYETFKVMNLDLKKLYVLSRELFIADNEFILNNYEIVKKYNLNLNESSARYFLLIPHIEEKIDYYVEQVSKDSKGNLFNGYDFINSFPSNLNSVSDITIKRLHYSLENDLKIFGTNGKSLTGEITNLKVDTLNISGNYFSKYLNNNFDFITTDEYSNYVTIINSTNNYSDEIDDTLLKLKGYENGLNYLINGINISKNKVIRNYNKLISNGIDHKKALLFAICYNLVVTEDEYQKIKSFVDNGGL